MWKKLLFVAVLAIVVPRVYKFIWFLGYQRTVYNHYPGPCHRLSGIENGSEDIELLPSGKVLITSGYQMNPATSDFIGQVYMFDLERSENPPEVVAIVGDIALDPDAFNPLGIAHWEDQSTGEIFVFIINFRNQKENVVDRFRFEEDKATLYHLETLKDPNFFILNSMVITGNRQFYFTNVFNDMPGLEEALQLYRGFVGYFDGKESKIVAGGMLMPNGIAISPDKKYVYVNHMFEQDVMIYERQMDNSLSLKQVHKVSQAPDNLFVDVDTGDLWVAGSPLPYLTFKYLNDPKQIAPSQVLRLTMKDGGVQDVVEVLVDDGRLHSGSSVAVYWKKKLLVGSIFTTALYCDVRYI